MTPLNPLLSTRSSLLSLSPTLALTAAAKALQSQGVDLISLAAGEPDMLPPEFILAALQEAAVKPSSCAYTATAGLLELRTVISQWLQSDRSLTFDPQSICVTPGCKMALYQALFVLLNPGDEVLFGAPYWVSYPQMTLACDGVPVPVTTDTRSNFLLSAAALSQAITPRSKVLILNSPHNPTGQAHTRMQLLEIAECLRLHPQIVVLCDDIYDSLVSDPIPHLLHVAPDLASRTVVINGLSKSFGVTGWRLGFAAGPNSLIEAMIRLQSQTTTCVAAPIQYAAISAYTYANRKQLFSQSAELYRQRSAVFLNELSKYSEISCLPMQHSFYIWADCRALLDRTGLDDSQLAQCWLEEANVAAVPGGAFGTPGFMRFSLTQPSERLNEAAKRIGLWIEGSLSS